MRHSARSRFAFIALGLLLGGSGVRAAEIESLPARLVGTWDFALGDPPGGPQAAELLPFRRVKVPGYWQDSGVPAHGIGWYRYRFELGPAARAVPLAFSCTQIRDADEVFLDGLRVGKTGGFPPAYEKATFVQRVYELPPTLTAAAGPHTLLVRVYNPGPRKGGLTGEPVIDSISSALAARAFRETPKLILSAAIGALALFSFFVWLRDRRQVDFLFFFLYAASFAVYGVLWLSAWARTPVSLSLLFRLNFAGNFATFVVCLLFFFHFFDHPLQKRHKALIAVHAAGTAFCLFWPRVDDLYYALSVFYLTLSLGSAEILTLLVKDSRRRVPYARVLLGGATMVFCAALFDIGQDLGLFGDPAGLIRVVAPTFLVFTVLFLSVVADRFARLQVAASTDALTGLPNRAAFVDRIALELARARRYRHPLALAVLDLDHFKDFNDLFGHAAGDRLLSGAADAIRRAIRDTDFAARYGGEEFVVVLPQVSGADVLVCLERIRKTVRDVRVPGVAKGTSISIGVALLDPSLGASSVSIGAIFRKADAALYAAKSKGRDCIVVAEGNPVGSSASGIFVLDALSGRSAAVGADREAGKAR